MASDEANAEPNLLRVEMHYNGYFERYPLSYCSGSIFTFTDHDFGGMDLRECTTFIARFLQEEVVKIYYCVPNETLKEGLRWIKDDGIYSEFLADGYGRGGEVSIYVDHFGDDLHDWFVDQEGSDVDTVDEDDEKVSGLDGHDDEKVKSDEGTDLEDLVFMPNMLDDEFLTKLCTSDKGEKIKVDPEYESDECSIDVEGDKDPEIPVYSKFIESTPWKHQKPVLGQRFENPKQLKNMLCNYGVAHGYQLCFKKNDKRILLVKCCEGKCSFRLWASWMGDEQSFQIKSLKADHNCSRNYKLGPLVTYAWIGTHYTKEILQSQKISIRNLRLEVMKKFGIQVSLSQCRRAKEYAFSLIEGTLVEHYAKLWSYAEEIRRSNPGSTVKLDVLNMPDGKNYFNKFYVCFEGVRRGWLEGCRRVIGIDGCFLKGICTGELICAVGRDANNQIYPIAWGVVCVENKENWKWFIDLLIDDLQLHTGIGLTLMSDQHKGLIEAVKDLLPHTEHRQCGKHIVANLKKRFNGVEYENLFWKACRATTQSQFNDAMTELEKLNPKSYAYLMDKNPKTWSKAFFETGRCCESVENGMCESFNALIVDARKKPIITMLEEIRLYMMERLFQLKKQGWPWQHEICPKIMKLVDLLKKSQRFWQVVPSGLNKFETRCEGDAYEVDLERNTCSCRLWQINGYGCVHSEAAVGFVNKDIQSFLDPIFNTINYMKTYAYSIAPMNGSSMWPETNYIPPLPPKFRRMPGRPAVKRKRDSTEGGTRLRVSKKGKKIVCSLCKEPGHNKTTCKKSGPPLPKLKLKKKKVEIGDCSQVGENKCSVNSTPISTFTNVNTQGSSEFGHNSQQGPNQRTSKPGDQNSQLGKGKAPASGPSRVKKATNVVKKNKASNRIGRMRKSERILKKKLSIQVGDVNGEGNSKDKPVELA